MLRAILLLCGFVSPRQSVAQQYDAAADKAALLAIKALGVNSLLSPEAQTWVAESDPCSGGWEGVGCLPDGRVSLVEADGESLLGDLDVFARLLELRVLDLGASDRGSSGDSGSIRGDIMALTVLLHLEKLDLRQSPAVTGDIAAIAGLPRLMQLSLTGTSVFGDIASLNAQTNLRSLHLRGTNIFGSISALPSMVGDVQVALCSDYNMCAASGLTLRPFAAQEAGQDQCACCVESPIVRSNLTGVCTSCAATGEHFYKNQCVKCPQPQRCVEGVCVGNSVGKACAVCMVGYFGTGSTCKECSSTSAQYVQFVVVIVAMLGICMVLWKLSEADVDAINVVDAVNDLEDVVGEAVDTAADLKDVTSSFARISNNAIICSIALPNLFQIAFVFSLPSLSLPPLVHDFGDWVASLIAFDLASAGSPECQLFLYNEQTFFMPYAMTNLGFILVCFILTVPTICSTDASGNKTRHAINARTAAYTIALPALTRAWVQLLDFTEQPDGTYTLDGMPQEPLLHESGCYPGCQAAIAGGLTGCVWAVLVPIRLFVALRKFAADDKWSHDEVEAYAWLLLKYKPNRWYFEFPLMYCKMWSIAVSLLLDTHPWFQLLCLCVPALVILIWVLVDKPYRSPDRYHDGMTKGDRQMVAAQLLQLLSYGVAAICLMNRHHGFGGEDVELFSTLTALVIVLAQVLVFVQGLRSGDEVDQEGVVVMNVMMESSDSESDSESKCRG